MSSQRNSRPGVIRSVVFDLQPLWRSTLTSMLDRAGYGPVVVCKSMDRLAYVLAGDLGPQLLVADPADDVHEFAAHLRATRERLPRLTTIVVSARCDEECRRLAADAGAAVFIRKQCELVEIEDSLHEAVEERFQWSRLTRRELEILELVAGGRSNRQVAASLWLSDQTVKFHLSNVYRKLGVASRAAAVEHARREGLLPAATVNRAVRTGQGPDFGLRQAAAM